MWSRRSRSSSPSSTAVARASSFGTRAGRPCRTTRSPTGAPSTRPAGGTSSPASATSRKVVRSTRHGEDEHFFLIAMPVDVETEIEIDRPREEVAADAADRATATAWYENIESVEWKSAPAEVAVGARIAFVARFLGRRLRLRVRDTGPRLGRAARDEHDRRSLPDGDDLRLGERRR